MSSEKTGGAGQVAAMSKESSELFEGTNGSCWGTSAENSSTNKFSDKTTWSSTLEEGKQGKHIEGHSKLCNREEQDFNNDGRGF